MTYTAHHLLTSTIHDIPSFICRSVVLWTRAIAELSTVSFGTAILVGFGLHDYRWVFSAERFLQSAVASGTSSPQPGGPVIITFQRPPRLKRRERTPAAEWGTMGEKFPRSLPKVATSTSLLGSFTCRKFTTWDRRLYFPSERRRAEDFFARKIRRLWPGLNPRTRVPEANTLTSRLQKPLSTKGLANNIFQWHPFAQSGPQSLGVLLTLSLKCMFHRSVWLQYSTNPPKRRYLEIPWGNAF